MSEPRWQTKSNTWGEWIAVRIDLDRALTREERVFGIKAGLMAGSSERLWERIEQQNELWAEYHARQS